jgi:lytic murein transglycosylase
VTIVPPRPSPLPAAPSQISAAAGFEAFKPYLVQRARSAGVREATIQAYVPTLRLSERAMQLDRAQKPVATPSNNAPAPLSPYLLQHVTPSLISRGQARYYRHWPNLIRAYNLHGVDPAVVMAIFGKETSYGAVTGNFDLLDALASLAYEGRRRELFATEFVAALKLIDSGVPRDRLKGSYAGATGYPQFMPSVVLNRRADGDGDGQADIWSNEADALASISNYLRQAGWKANVPWGTAARVPVTLDRAAIRPTEEAPRCPAVFRRHSRELPVAKWRELGVTITGQRLHDGEMARLIEPDGPGATAYLLTNNYRAILEYNCSNAYALSVALLADAIARR